MCGVLWVTRSTSESNLLRGYDWLELARQLRGRFDDGKPVHTDYDVSSSQSGINTLPLETSATADVGKEKTGAVSWRANCRVTREGWPSRGAVRRAARLVVAPRATVLSRSTRAILSDSCVGVCCVRDPLRDPSLTMSCSLPVACT